MKTNKRSLRVILASALALAAGSTFAPACGSSDPGPGPDAKIVTPAPVSNVG